MTKEQRSWMLRGAAMERTATLAHLRRLLKQKNVLQGLGDWLLARHNRYNQRPGGLGR